MLLLASALALSACGQATAPTLPDDSSPSAQSDIPATPPEPPADITPDQSAAPDAGQPPAAYTLNDIAGHNDRNDCWTAIDGGVYDVTEFIPGHPGGAAIIQACGRDASQLFGAKHEDKAREQLKSFRIGDLE